MNNKNINTEAWRKKLTSEEFNICWEKGTERAFSGKFNDEKAAGVYVCCCCSKPLFHSEEKYDSGSGWPSFFDVVDKHAVDKNLDYSHGMVRTEALCAYCGSHLGHVFTDGPEPTGLRYCINSLSLNLIKT